MHSKQSRPRWTQYTAAASCYTPWYVRCYGDSIPHPGRDNEEQTPAVITLHPKMNHFAHLRQVDR